MKQFIIASFFVLILLSSFAHGEDFGDVDIHGFIAQGFLQSNENNFLAKTKDGTFEFNEMGINFTTELTGKLNLGIQFFARDLGGFDNDEIQIDWAYADYHYKPWLGIRIGKTRCPFGLYNKTRDVDMLRSSIFLPQGVYNESWRDSLKALKGSSLYGAVPLGLLGGLRYNLLAGVMDVPDEGGVSAFVSNRTLDVDKDWFLGAVKVSYSF